MYRAGGNSSLVCLTLSPHMLDLHEETVAVSVGEAIMSLPKYQESRLLDEACGMIEDMGGVGALIEDLAEFHELHARMNRQRPALVEKYPGKWVAVGMNGVLAVEDSEEKALQAVENRDVRGSDVLVEFMDPDPPVLIL